MQKCPCCKARLKQADSCPRCQADLQTIIQIQRQARCWQQKAIAYYLNDEWQNCLHALTQSLQLQQRESTLMFRAFVIEKENQAPELWRLTNNLKQAATLSIELVKRWLTLNMSKLAASMKTTDNLKVR